MNGRVKLSIIASIMLLGFLTVSLTPHLQSILGPSFVGTKGALPAIQPWTPNSTEPYEPLYGPGPLINLTIAYIGYSNVSYIIVNWTETYLRWWGGYPLIWIKEPDPSRPVNVDGLLVDGFWLMEHMELGLQYIANVLSIQELPPRYYRRVDFAEGWPETAPWKYYAGEDWVEWAKNERPVVILPGFKAIPILKAILETLGDMITDCSLSWEDVEWERKRLIRWYGSADILGWWCVKFDKNIWLHDIEAFKGLTDNGKLYDVWFDDHTQQSENPDYPNYNEDPLFTIEALADNDLTAWKEFILMQLDFLALAMEWW